MNLKSQGPIKVAVFQRIIPHFRIPVFTELTSRETLETTIYYGKGTAHGGFRNAKDFSGLVPKRLCTVSIDFSFRNSDYQFVYHPSAIYHLIHDKYNVVVSEGATNLFNNLFLFTACRLSRKGFIWWGPGVLHAKKSLIHRVFAPLEHYFIRHADACIAYSSAAGEFFSAVSGQPDKVFVAQNSIDDRKIRDGMERYRDSVPKLRESLGLDNYRVILYTGTVIKRKRIDLLISSFARLVSNHPKTALLIMGVGDERTSLMEMVRGRKIPNITFLGSIWEEAPAYFMLADLFVLPSHGGLAINEAMAYGLPVIAADADGTSRDLVMDGITGFMIPEGDEVKLEETIELALSDDNHLKQMGQNAYELIEKSVNLKNMVDKMEEAILWAQKRRKITHNEN